MAVLFAVLLAPLAAADITRSDFIPFGSGAGDASVDLDDGCNSITAAGTYIFFGQTMSSSVHFGTNGIMSSGASCVNSLSGSAFPTTSSPAVAIAWSDLDPLDGPDPMYSRETTSSSDISTLTSLLSSVGVTFTPTHMLVQTWIDSPYFTNGAGTNTLQSILATDGSETYAVFLYETLSVRNSGSTQVGFDAGDSTNFFSVEGSLTSAIFDVDDSSNVGLTGMYVFKVSGTVIEDLGGDTPGAVGDPVLIDFAGHRFFGGKEPSTDYLLYRSADGSAELTITTGDTRGLENGYFAVSATVRSAGCGVLRAAAQSDAHKADVTGDECMVSRIAQGDEGLVMIPIHASGAAVVVFPHGTEGRAAFVNVKLVGVTQAFRAGCTGMLCDEHHEDLL